MTMTTSLSSQLSQSHFGIIIGVVAILALILAIIVKIIEKKYSIENDKKF